MTRESAGRLDPQRPNAELMLWAYARGIFPMGDSETGEIEWFSPDPRGVIPLDGFHVPRRLGRVVRARRFEPRTDSAFETTVRACAEPRPGRESTWLDERLIAAYLELHRIGHAHSIEAWRDDRLVGGIYGVHIGAAFFGESMFSRAELGGRDASKVCLVHLVDLLRARGFRLFDAQFTTSHLEQFGCRSIPRPEYLRRLHGALAVEARWPRGPDPLLAPDPAPAARRGGLLD